MPVVARQPVRRTTCVRNASRSVNAWARPSRVAPSHDSPEVAELRDRSTELGVRIAELDAVVNEVQAALEELLLQIPNPPDAGCARR